MRYLLFGLLCVALLVSSCGQQDRAGERAKPDEPPGQQKKVLTTDVVETQELYLPAPESALAILAQDVETGRVQPTPLASLLEALGRIVWTDGKQTLRGKRLPPTVVAGTLSGTQVLLPGPSEATIAEVVIPETIPAETLLTMTPPRGPAEPYESLIVVIDTPQTMRLVWNDTAFSTERGLPWPTRTLQRLNAYLLWWHAGSQAWMFVGTIFVEGQ